MSELRPYQADGIAALRQKLAEGKRRIVFYLPTGGGKSRVAAAIVAMARAKGKRVAFLCNRIELVAQASAVFRRMGIDHGILQGGNSRSAWESVLVGSIQTVVRRGMEDIDLLIVDEAHGCPGSKEYLKLIAATKAPLIGLTATPFAAGMAKQNEAVGGPLFEDIVIAATIPDLIRDGFLVDCDIYGPSEPDLSGVKIVAGDYHEKQLGEAVDKEPLIGDIVKTWSKLGQGWRTICFATNIAHSQHIVEQFRAAGVSAEHIDAYTPDDERKRIIAGFRAGEFKIISNCAILAEGFDVPEAGCMILARPTRSMVRYIQMAGRVLRPSEGKSRAIILDHSGTCRRLGFPTDELPLVLDDGKARVSGAAAPKEKLPKICPSCSLLKPAGVHVCPSCGFAPVRQSDVEVEDGELVALRPGPAKISTTDKAAIYGQLRWIARERGYSNGWASHKFREKTGVWPNAYHGVPEFEPTAEMRSWVRSRAIAFAKRRTA